MNLHNFSNLEPFNLNKEKKEFFFKNRINQLTLFHSKRSYLYKRFLKKFNYKLNKINSLDQVPFLPARTFKEIDLMSVSKKDIFKTIMSSGTTGTQSSKIYLDKKNAQNQVIVLNKIVKTILGNNRIPMLIIDKDPRFGSKNSFNASAAAIYGFSIFGTDHTYLINRNNEIDYKSLERFISKYKKQKFFIFGFTSLIYEYLINNNSLKKKKLDLSNAILLHGGGWKKMERKKIKNSTFKMLLENKFKLRKVYNYYGLVEQTGSIFLECEKCSCFITSVFSDIIIRDLHFNLVKKGDKGFIQLFSILPTSYPGHNILTEDVGKIIDNSKCICAKKGKAFLVYGRMPRSEIRGCSDTI